MTPKGRSRCNLLSLTEQWASIGQRRFHFREGETIHTGSSRKYDREGLGALAGRAGWRVSQPGRTTSGCPACSRSRLRPGGVRADVSPRGVAGKPQATAAAGLARVTLPARNRRDYDDIPPGAREKLEFVWLERVDDAIAAALEGGSNPGCAGSRCCDADRAVRGGRAARAVTARPARPNPCVAIGPS